MGKNTTRWSLSIRPTRQGCAKYPTWKHFPSAVTVYSKADLDRRVREADTAKAAGDITSYTVARLS